MMANTAPNVIKKQPNSKNNQPHNLPQSYIMQEN